MSLVAQSGERFIAQAQGEARSVTPLLMVEISDLLDFFKVRNNVLIF
jgi:hypothetical protein